MNMNPPVGNFANSSVWCTIVFKVSAFPFFALKTSRRDTLVENPKLNANNHFFSTKIKIEIGVLRL